MPRAVPLGQPSELREGSSVRASPTLQSSSAHNGQHDPHGTARRRERISTRLGEEDEQEICNRLDLGRLAGVAVIPSSIVSNLLHFLVSYIEPVSPP